MSEDYKNHPVSLAEVRAGRTESPGDWTPRDVLVSLLREIDSGAVKPRHLIVCISEQGEDTLTDRWVQAGEANAHEQLGLLQSGLLSMYHTNKS